MDSECISVNKRKQNRYKGQDTGIDSFMGKGRAHSYQATISSTSFGKHSSRLYTGGGASKNIPAAKLYGRFGFVSVPRHNEGGPFSKPDKDLFVL
eukprot:scaffold29477_cov388-Skeletonema_menzelii.AAC.1